MAQESNMPLVCVIDDDEDVRSSLGKLLCAAGFRVHAFSDPEQFAGSEDARDISCLVIDVGPAGTRGLLFQQKLAAADAQVPVVLIASYGDISTSVQGMRAGAVSYLPKPFEDDAVLAAVREGVERDRCRRSSTEECDGIRARYDRLTRRERDVMALVAAGLMNKQIAGRLELSEITVKIHRGNMMRKMQAESLADLVRMAESLSVRNTAVSRYRKRN